jgi:hypothetical protein
MKLYMKCEIIRSQNSGVRSQNENIYSVNSVWLNFIQREETLMVSTLTGSVHTRRTMNLHTLILRLAQDERNF